MCQLSCVLVRHITRGYITLKKRFASFAYFIIFSLYKRQLLICLNFSKTMVITLIDTSYLLKLY